MLLDPRYTWMRQLAAFTVLLAIWELAGRAGMLNPMYVPNPSRIGAALIELFSDGRIWPHLDATSAPRSAVSRSELPLAFCSALSRLSFPSSRNCSSR
jgi:ABC-type nitrate/sulfonate/bicarbonate transport system, permease component